MKPYYINEDPAIKAVHDGRTMIIEGDGLTVNTVFRQHVLLMDIVTETFKYNDD